MSAIFARKALLPQGWTNDVRLRLDGGRIIEVQAGSAATTNDATVDIVIPGLCNAHSHAFQRGLAGRTEQRSPAGKDNFWSWRTRMYELANRIDARQMAAIATQAYSEMLQAGYTAVAEFHYLHDDPATNGDAMFMALQEAAATTGIRLTYVPVFYERAGFDNAAPLQHQRRFVSTLETFLKHQQRCSEQAAAATIVAIGAHSLRAVAPDSLQAIASVAHEQQIPLHLHIAEQQAEIEQCLAATGQRPVEWLLENSDVNAHWCLVHATHINASEIAALAKSDAVVCICPTTEANLGDGLFPLRAFLEQGGAIAIGSDSQASINPFEELRWLEYGQRLATQSRNVAENLFTQVLAGGARAGGAKPAGLDAGGNADLVVLDASDPMLAGHDDDTLLDALVFSGYALPISRVMVAGEWRVGDGQHVDQAAIRQAFAATMRSLQ